MVVEGGKTRKTIRSNVQPNLEEGSSKLKSFLQQDFGSLAIIILASQEEEKVFEDYPMDA